MQKIIARLLVIIMLCNIVIVMQTDKAYAEGTYANADEAIAAFVAGLDVRIGDIFEDPIFAAYMATYLNSSFTVDSMINKTSIPSYYTSFNKFAPIYCDSKGITSIKGLEILYHMKAKYPELMKFGSNNLTDLDGLQYLNRGTSISTTLELQDNNITKIDGELKGYINTLDLSNNPLESINLPGLSVRTLKLDNANFETVEKITGLLVTNTIRVPGAINYASPDITVVDYINTVLKDPAQTSITMTGATAVLPPLPATVNYTLDVKTPKISSNNSLQGMRGKALDIRLLIDGVEHPTPAQYSYSSPLLFDGYDGKVYAKKSINDTTITPVEVAVTWTDVPNRAEPLSLTTTIDIMPNLLKVGNTYESAHAGYSLMSLNRVKNGETKSFGVWWDTIQISNYNVRLVNETTNYDYRTVDGEAGWDFDGIVVVDTINNTYTGVHYNYYELFFEVEIDGCYYSISTTPTWEPPPPDGGGGEEPEEPTIPEGTKIIDAENGDTFDVEINTKATLIDVVIPVRILAAITYDGTNDNTFKSANYSIINYSTAPIVVTMYDITEKSGNPLKVVNHNKRSIEEWKNLGRIKSMSEIALGVDIGGIEYWSDGDSDRVMYQTTIDRFGVLDYKLTAKHGKSYSNALLVDYKSLVQVGLAD